MNCDTCHSLIPEYLYEELDASARAEFEIALSACSDCATALAAQQRTVAMYRVLDPIEVPERLHADMMRAARVHADVLADASVSWWRKLFSVPMVTATATVSAAAIAAFLIVGGPAGVGSEHGPVPEEVAMSADAEPMVPDPSVAVLDEVEEPSLAPQQPMAPMGRMGEQHTLGVVRETAGTGPTDTESPLGDGEVAVPDSPTRVVSQDQEEVRADDGQRVELAAEVDVMLRPLPDQATNAVFDLGREESSGERSPNATDTAGSTGTYEGRSDNSPRGHEADEDDTSADYDSVVADARQEGQQSERDRANQHGAGNVPRPEPVVEDTTAREVAVATPTEEAAPTAPMANLGSNSGAVEAPIEVAMEYRNDVELEEEAELEMARREPSRPRSTESGSDQNDEDTESEVFDDDEEDDASTGYEEALAWYGSGDYAQAASGFESLLAAGVRVEEATYYLGASYFQLGQTDRAQHVLNAFVQDYPTGPFVDDARQLLERLQPRAIDDANRQYFEQASEPHR